MFVDSHCHLDRLSQNQSQLAKTLKFAESRGVEHFLCVSVSVREYEAMRQTVSGFDNVSVSCGVHPLHQEDCCAKQDLLNACMQSEVVAVGETGLDYHYSPESKNVQMQSFIDHVEVANAVNKPLIVHTREAKADTLDILSRYKNSNIKGVLHCFTETLDMAEAAIDLGFYISFSGIVTFKSAQQLQEVAKAIPLERMLIETDSPWLAPVPYRGQQNQPGYVVEVAEFIAKLRGIDKTEIAQKTTDNFYQLFSRIQRVNNA